MSVITSKGQTTIPKEVRDFLGLKPHDRIVYVPDGKRIFLKAVSGTILDLKGAIKRPGRVDFERLRDTVKEKVAEAAVEK